MKNVKTFLKSINQKPLDPFIYIIKSPKSNHYKNQSVAKFFPDRRKIVLEKFILLKKPLQNLFSKVKKAFKDNYDLWPESIFCFNSIKKDLLLRINVSMNYPEKKLFELQEFLKNLDSKICGGSIHKNFDKEFCKVMEFGRNFTYEKVDNFLFRISSESNFPENSYILPDIILYLKNLFKKDFYNTLAHINAKVGVFTIPLARIFNKSFGFDPSPYNVYDALINKDLARLQKILYFFSKSILESIPDLISINPDVLIIENKSPISPKFFKEVIKNTFIKKIVLISDDLFQSDFLELKKYNFKLEKLAVAEISPKEQNYLYISSFIFKR